jgi:CRISPR-associated endonuclease/helicase Cas3
MAAGYESHLGRRLDEHLQQVAEGARTRLDHPALRHRGLLGEVAYLAGLAHDVGKYTTFFQAYLRKGERFNGLEHHAFLGAVFAAWLVSYRLPALPEAPGKEFLPLLVYMAVHRHHGHLRSLDELVPASRELKRWPELGNIAGEQRRALEALQLQLVDIRDHSDDILPELQALGLPEAAEFLTSGPDLYKLFRELDEMRYRLDQLSAEDGARLCLWGQLLFSALIDADKFSAAGLSTSPRPPIPPDLVEQYLQMKYPRPRHDLDRHRAAFHQAVRQRMEELKSEESAGQIFSLTAPTGMGKTFAALDAALRMREKLHRHWGVPPRIIYALPFVNIIEQNYEELHNVLSALLPAYNQAPENFLLRHHYLAEVMYRRDNDTLPVEKALLMTEAWESEIVVTTFVQLFQTLLGYQNRFLKKLHNLIGAIVVLDEVQALPMEYWPVTAKVFKTLCRELGLVVIQMTATRPLIFPAASELHPHPASLFTIQRRTRLHIELKERSLEEWAACVADLYQQHGSLLAVVNTITASLRIYERLRSQTTAKPFAREAPKADGKTAEEWLVYLSTNITPRQRQQRLEAVKAHLKKGGRALVVSTQVIEAGVDIDFPAVVRDLGPLDAIVQVAGRCNREGQRDQGEVYLLPLEGGGCAQVYGAVHAHVARRLLEGKSQLEEPEYAHLVELYFQEAQQRLSQQASIDLWKAYCRLRYDHFEESALSEFHLIESPEQVPIFVALTPEDEAWLRNEFIPQVLREQDATRRKVAYLRHRKRLHESMIRPLLQRTAQNLPPAIGERENLRWIPYRQLTDYYDVETGFKWRPQERLWAS